MERRTFLKLAALVPGLALAGCGGSKTLLSPKDPTMLSIWHVSVSYTHLTLPTT